MGGFTPTSSGADADIRPAAKPLPLGRPDKYIWAIYVFICLISIVELYSASSREVRASAAMGVLAPLVRHIVFLGVGLGIMLFFQRLHYRTFLKWTWLFVLISVALMLYVDFFGEIVNGARRSVRILGITIQPAEMIKLSAVLVLALVLARTQLSKGIGVSDRGVWISAVAVLFFSGLLINQGLTNTLLLMTISIAMMLIGGIRMKKLLLVLVGYAACGSLYVLYLLVAPPPTHKEFRTYVETDSRGQLVVQTDTLIVESEGSRLSTWINRMSRHSDDSIPKYDQKITRENYQEMYAYMAQANSRGIGVGPGNSRETSRLPLAFSDYIYSIIVEDLGLVGAIFVLVLYLCLLGRASGIASRCSRAYPSLLVLGLAVMIVMQAIVHIAINTGIAPVSGQPLPLISKGGTSIIITSAALGIMLSVSRYAASSKNEQREVREEFDALPEEMRADNPTQL